MSNMEAHTVAELFVQNLSVISELLIISILTMAAILNPLY